MADEHAPINLKVLSPSTEVKGDIYIPDLPASTTVKELRFRLQDEIEGRPATERMRLIYRGRVVAQETDRLVDVFGLDNIRTSKEQTLHLVLRELHPTSTSSSPAPRTSAQSPNPFRPFTNPPQSQTGLQQNNNPFRAVPPQLRPNSQPQIPHAHPHAHPHHHHAHHHHHPQQPHNPIGVPLPPLMFQQQLAQAMAQNNAHNGVQQNQRSRGGTPVPQNGVQTPAAGASPVPSPGPLNFAPSTTRTVRHESIGPNGERVTVTWNNTNITIPANSNQQPILPRPFPHPPGFPMTPRQSPGPPVDAIDQILARARTGLLTARQEMENVRVLLQGPAGEPATFTPPLWRIDRIRHHVQNLTQGLDQVQRGLSTLSGDPSMVNNRDVVLLQQSANELRGHAEELNAMLDRMRDGAASGQEPVAQNNATAPLPSTGSSTAPQSTFPLGASQTATRSSSSPASPELFLLSSPQGPVGILFDQRGTYSTAPMVSTLPFQSFTQQFANNRHLLAGIGQHIVQNTNQLQHQLAANRPDAQNNQPQPAAQGLPDPPMARNADQNQNQPANQAPAPDAAAAENDRLNIWVGHAWFVFKVLIFIYLFAWGGGWYRPAILALTGLLMYLVQLGIFEEQFNQIRQRFEGILAVPDGNGQQPNRQNQDGNVEPQAQAQGGAERVEPGRNLTPEQAAQRLMQQHGNHPLGWIRESTRSIERAFTIFIASLWPGIGEGMVRAVEEREQAERQAEEERQRQEEERREQEAQQAEEEKAASSEEKAEVELEERPRDAKESKGKEKVEGTGEASSSG